MGSDPRKIRQHQELTVVKAISRMIDAKYPPTVDSPLIPKPFDKEAYRRHLESYIRGDSSPASVPSVRKLSTSARPGLTSGVLGVAGNNVVGNGSGAAACERDNVGGNGSVAAAGERDNVGGSGSGAAGDGPGASAASEGPSFPEGVNWGNAWEVLVKFLRSEFPDVRRLSASALGKLAPLRPPYPAILPALLSLAEDDQKPQVRQYAVKAIGRYAEFAIDCLDPLKDVARDESAPEYVRTAAAEVVASIQESHRSTLARKHHFCTRCKRIITEPEYRQGMSRWGKPYCRHCYDEKLLEDRNFESMVEDAKKKRSSLGTAVQSRGEKFIADFLESEHIAYEYDARYMIAGDTRIRPDFYLPEFDVYIEYFGMNTPEYRDNMLKKRILYQRAGKKLVSVSYEDADPASVLRQKLSRYFRI